MQLIVGSNQTGELILERAPSKVSPPQMHLLSLDLQYVCSTSAGIKRGLKITRRKCKLYPGTLPVPQVLHHKHLASASALPSPTISLPLLEM